MKTANVLLTVFLALALVLTGCGRTRPAESAAPAAEPQVTAEVPTPAEDAGQTAVIEHAEPAVPAGRQDGERFEETIILEGMEETVRYEHVRNDSVGIEMDYDYESLVRRSDAGRERFISIYDNQENPENYLEVTFRSVSADAAAAFVRELLSRRYDLLESTRELERAGSCLTIEASELKGTGRMADQLQTVYIIPAADGCRIATAHCSIESAEGFGRRFSYLVNTLAVVEHGGERKLSDEDALAAVYQYTTEMIPGLADMANSGESAVCWDIADSDESRVTVEFRSYTGALNRFTIDRVTGEAAVTEFVPGIMTEEQPTGETLNAWDFLT